MSYSVWSGGETMPGIHQVLQSFWELGGNGMLFRHTVASLFRVTVGFYLALLVAIPAGLFLGRCQMVNRWLNPVIQFLRPISPLAWVPFAMLWFGIGDPPALFIIFLASLFPILIPTTKASASIHPMYFQVAANLQLGILETLRQVMLPATLPSIVLALRVTLGVAWMVVVAAEMIAVKGGLGFLIIDARNALRLEHAIVSMITIGVIGLLLDRVMLSLERMESLRWHFEQK